MTRSIVSWALFLALCIALIAWVAEAEAQGANCAPAERRILELTKDGKTPEVSAFQDRGSASIVQFWSNPQTQEWVIVRLRPNGTACILESGAGFVRIRVGDPA